MQERELVHISSHIIDGETVNTTNARELHAFLGVGKDYTNWIKEQIERAKLLETQDYLIFAEKGENSGRGRPRAEYYLTLDAAKSVAMMSGTDKGREVRLWFIRRERQLRRLEQAPFDMTQIWRPLIEELVEARLAADPRYRVVVDYKPALDVLIEMKVPSRRRRAFSNKVSGRLKRFCIQNDYEVRVSRETGRLLFPVTAIDLWLKDGGATLISDHIRAITGQGVLPFKPHRVQLVKDEVPPEDGGPQLH